MNAYLCCCVNANAVQLSRCDLQHVIVNLEMGVSVFVCTGKKNNSPCEWQIERFKQTPFGLCFISVSGLILRVIRLKSVPCSVFSSMRKATVPQASSERDFPILTLNKSNTIQRYTEQITNKTLYCSASHRLLSCMVALLFNVPDPAPVVCACVCVIAQIGTNEPCLWSLGSGLYSCCGLAHFTIVSILLTTISPQMFRHSSTVFTEVTVSPLKRTTTFQYHPSQFQVCTSEVCNIFSIKMPRRYQSLKSKCLWFQILARPNYIDFAILYYMQI